MENVRLYVHEKIQNEWVLCDANSFTIENKVELFENKFQNREYKYTSQYDLKLFLIHKTLSFTVESIRDDNTKVFARSIEFTTHDCGRKITKEMKERDYKPQTNLLYLNSLYNRDNELIYNNESSQIFNSYDIPYFNDNYSENYESSNFSVENWTHINSNLQVNGDIRAKEFIQYSDFRLKTNIEELTDAMDIILSLNAKKFQWKKDSNASDGQIGGKRAIGLIAQEVRKVLPNIVDEHNGYLSVSYSQIIPILVEALKQHIIEMKEFKKGIEQQVIDLREALNLLSQNTEKTKSFRKSLDLTSEQVKERLRQEKFKNEKINKSINHKKIPNELNRFIKQHKRNNSIGYNEQANVEINLNSKGLSSHPFDESDFKLKKIKWKIVSVILILLTIASVGLGVYLLNYKLPISPTVSYELLSQSSFESINENGDVNNWEGPYLLATTRLEDFIEMSDRIRPIEDEWVKEIQPYHGDSMLQLSTNTTSNVNFYAKMKIPIDDYENIRYFNVSARAAYSFDLEKSIASSIFQFNVFINYEKETLSYGVDFDHDDMKKWNYIEAIIECKKMKIESVEIILVSTFIGTSFWDLIELKAIRSELPDYIYLSNEISPRYCNGLLICT